MAITRAQQFKQMLAQGGRIGLQGGGKDMGKERGDFGRAGRDEREIRARSARTERAAAANQRALAALGDPTPDIKEQPNLFKALGLGAMKKIAKIKFPFIPGGIDFSGPTQFAGLKSDDRFGGRDEGINNMLYRQMMAQEPRTMDTMPTEEDDEEEKLKDLRALAFRAEGGSMNDQIRQAYGIGDIVKKATSAVKKVAKSPIGKAALLYGAGRLGMAGLGQFRAGTGIFSPTGFLKSKALPFLVGTGGRDAYMGSGPTKGILGAAGKLSSFKAITAASLLPLVGLGTGDESEEEAQAILDQSGLDLDAIRESYLGEDQYRARRFKAEGGRMGYDNGGYTFDQFKKDKFKVDQFMGEEQMRKLYEKMMREKKIREQRTMVAEGGSMKEPVAKKTMPLLDMGGQEMDLRAEGGFVPIGRMEKADDVPARLSKNEFVFTADAGRNAGEGNVDKGAEVMYNMMKNLEAGGDVSEESQGLKGARRMFQTSQRLEEVL